MTETLWTKERLRVLAQLAAGRAYTGSSVYTEGVIDELIKRAEGVVIFEDERDNLDKINDALEAEQPKLVVTKDGVPFEDQAEGVRQFKEACRKAVDLTHISDDQLKQLWLSEQLPIDSYTAELGRRRKFLGATVVDPDKTNDDFKYEMYRLILELPTRHEWGVVRQLLMRIVSKL